MLRFHTTLSHFGPTQRQAPNEEQVPCDEIGDSELLLQLQQDGWKN